MKGKMLKSFIAGVTLVLGFATINPISASAAWKQDSTGWWNTEGNSYSIGWKQIDGSWYYFGSNGYMKTGWVNDNGSWYYLNSNGSMRTGWVNDNNTWYYLNNNGAMQTGWINYNGTWYYTNEHGAMQTGFLNLNNTTYYLNESGAMVTGDITINGVKYTFSQNGEKISSETSITNTNNTTNNSNVNTETTKSEENANEDKVSGGGGGGGGKAPASNSSIKDSDFCSYSDLYGTWTIDSYIDSGMKTELSGLIINSAINEQFTITKDKIESNGYTASNPIIKETILTKSSFKSKYGIDLSKIGISDDKVKCIKVTRRENTSQSVDVIVTVDKNIVAIVKGAAFKISR